MYYLGQIDISPFSHTIQQPEKIIPYLRNRSGTFGAGRDRIAFVNVMQSHEKSLKLNLFAGGRVDG